LQNGGHVEHQFIYQNFLLMSIGETDA